MCTLVLRMQKLTRAVRVSLKVPQPGPSKLEPELAPGSVLSMARDHQKNLRKERRDFFEKDKYYFLHLASLL